MDSILQFSKAVIEESRKFVEALFSSNEDYRKLGYSEQIIAVSLAVTALTTFRLVQLSNKLNTTDFFKD